MSQKINVVIADDHPLFRKGIRWQLERLPEYNIIGEASNGFEVLEIIANSPVLPDIVLLDVEMPGMDGLQTLDKLMELYLGIKVIVISQHYNHYFVAEFFLRGVRAYLAKEKSSDLMDEAIYFVLKDGYYLNSILSRRVLIQLIAGKKTKQLFSEIGMNDAEIKTLQLICEEKTNPEIALEMGVSTHTIDYYRRNIFSKTNQNSVVGLVKFAILKGITMLN
jgi:two-component system response regulator DegU